MEFKKTSLFHTMDLKITSLLFSYSDIQNYQFILLLNGIQNDKIMSHDRIWNQQIGLAA